MAAVPTADRRVREFLEENPGDVPARLFWAGWLVRTGRADEAVSYLRSPENFPELATFRIAFLAQASGSE